jgi:hypothetical protein
VSRKKGREKGRVAVIVMDGDNCNGGSSSDVAATL